jgi:hypothetical protein
MDFQLCLIGLGTTVSVQIADRKDLVPLYAGPAPTVPGVQQVNVAVPGDLAASATQIVICATIGGQQYCSSGSFQSQARMVGDVEALQPLACQSFAASRVPNCSKRPAHRRTVDGSGDRDASRTSGTDRSQLLSDCRSNSHASCRQWRL